MPGANRAASAWHGRRVVQRGLQIRHQATLAVGVLAHDVRLLLTHPGQSRPFGGVVHISLASGFPSRTVFDDHALHCQYFQQSLQPASAHTGLGFDFQQPPPCPGQTGQHLVGRLRVWNRSRCKVIPYALVGVRWQQNALGMGHSAPCPAHLLVIGHRGRWRAHVHTKSQIGFVIAHAQCRCGHHRLDLVVAQTVFHLQPRIGVDLTGVGIDRMATTAQKGCQAIGLGHGQHIHNARTRQLRQRIGNPGITRKR